MFRSIVIAAVCMETTEAVKVQSIPAPIKKLFNKLRSKSSTNAQQSGGNDSTFEMSTNPIGVAHNVRNRPRQPVRLHLAQNPRANRLQPRRVPPIGGGGGCMELNGGDLANVGGDIPILSRVTSGGDSISESGDPADLDIERLICGDLMRANQSGALLKKGLSAKILKELANQSGDQFEKGLEDEFVVQDSGDQLDMTPGGPQNDPEVNASDGDGDLEVVEGKEENTKGKFDAEGQ